VDAELRAKDRLQQRIVVPIDVTHGDEEIRRLRSSINDLISIQALPAIWDGRESGSIVSTLLDVLVSMLQLDFAYVRLSDSINGTPVEFVRLAQRRAPPPPALEIGRALDRWLTNQSAHAPLVVPNPAGDGELKIAPFRLGLTDEIGVLVAGSERANFPTPTESLLLGMAANQALVALQEARRLHEQKRAAEELERRVADRTAQLTGANEALRKSEHSLRRIEAYLSEGQRLSHTGSWAWSVKTKENLFWSREHYRIYGFDPDTDSGQYGVARERIHPADASAFDENLKRMMQEPIDFEIHYRIVLPGGEEKHIHTHGHPVLNNDGELVEYIGTSVDVTERKRAEEALRRSESYLAEAQRLSHTGSFGWSVVSGEIYWSEETHKIFELDPAVKPTLELVFERMHVDDREPVQQALDHAIIEKTDFNIEHRLQMPDGRVKHLHVIARASDTSSDNFEFVGAVMDVTERKRTEGRIRQIIDTIPAYAWSAKPDGAVDFINERFLEFTGRSNEEILGWEWESIIHPDDLHRFVGLWREALAAGAPMESEVRVRRSDGHYRWLLNRNVPLHDELGTIVKWYGTATDIDDRRRAEEALRTSHAALAHVSRLTTMGELTASIAHEVNQPLAAIVNNANACISLLPEGDPNLEEVREALAEIIDDVERATSVIARVRQLARKAPVEPIRLDLRDVIADVLALARHESARRRVAIHTEIPEETQFVLGDRVQLQQVLLNLVVNGMDAMNTVEESKRFLFIRGHRETREGRLESLVSVQDAGSGFKPEQMKRLFEAFYTTKSQGMGMGLAISRSIIEAHGGRLWAEPNQGPGATFVFTLPAAPVGLGDSGPAARSRTDANNPEL
jgi:PAS domain S-box-containing protein